MKNVIFLMLLILGACARVSMPDEFAYKEISTPEFTIATWVRETVRDDVFVIYIEGDGHAFNSRGAPTDNPTPRGDFVRRMAMNDDGANVAYIARPCQFVADDKCSQKYWTTARFAPAVIDSMATVITEISRGRDVTLVGFSGGANVAGLVAVMHPEIKVKKIITYAGNMDHRAWTEYHNLTPLGGSMNLADYRDEFLKFPSVHYIAENDTVVPSKLVIDFIDGAKDVITIKSAGH